MEIREYLPRGWRLEPQSTGLTIYATDAELAEEFHIGAKDLLERSAQNMQSVIQIAWDGCKAPLKVGKSKAVKASIKPDREPQPVHQPAANDSYAADRISVSASYEEVEDFVRGQRQSGKIVTIMSMNDRNPALNDLFLKVNDLQIQHRAGGWKMNQWVGTNARATVWVRSFDGTLPAIASRESGWNYYQELIRLLRSGETYIPGFQYLIDRPNNAGLWLDLTNYHFVEDYGGTAIRIAVSDPKDSTLIEEYAA